MIEGTSALLKVRTPASGRSVTVAVLGLLVAKSAMLPLNHIQRRGP